MEFALTDELIDQIIFAMEDQQHKILVNRHSGDLVHSEEVEDPEQFTSIPEWRPIDGYNLMEKFITKLRNPIFRELLKEALSSGKGVFRNFKNTLKKSREVEKLWFTFKEREMKQVVVRWYNEQRELAGLEQIGEEPEETEDLLLSDFTIREGGEEHLEAMVNLDRRSFMENYPDAEQDRIERCFNDMRKSLPGLGEPESLLFVAETPTGDFAGFVWGVEEEDPLSGNPVLRIVQLAVVEHHRGLGLGQLLIRRLTKEAYQQGYEKLTLELAAGSLVLAGFLQNLGFETTAQILELDLNRWEKNH